MLLLSVVRPGLECGNEICDCNKSQTNALESDLLGGASYIGIFWDVLVMKQPEGT